MSAPILRLWTDGTSADGLGGWAFVAERRGKVLERRSGVVEGASANEMELVAVAEALAYATGAAGAAEVLVCADCSYVIDGVNTWLPAWIKNGWQPVGRRGRGSKAIQNLDHWQRISDLSARLPRLRPARWVKGRSGAEFNARAGELSRLAVAYRGTVQ